MTLLIIRDR